jgi:hypothetical protein
MPCPLRYIALFSSLAIVTIGSVKASVLIEDKTYTELFFDFITGRFLFQFFALEEWEKETEVQEAAKAADTLKEQEDEESNYEWFIDILKKSLGLTESINIKAY